MGKRDNLGRTLSYALRHKPDMFGLGYDEQGWVSVASLLLPLNISKSELDDAVSNDSKQRFEYSLDETYIRARYGHSIAVAYLNTVEPPSVVFHGTSQDVLESIKAEGLKPMNRIAVHLTDDIETAFQVGSRHGRPHVLTVSAGAMYEAGYQFFFVGRGTWLTEHVPARFLS